jgi:hypothetical protein
VILGAIAGGFVGTVVLTTGSRLAQELGWTRMDIPLLLGTVFTSDRTRATVIGYALHFLNGLLFSLLYGLVFEAIGRAGLLLGLAFGFVHGAFAAGALLNVLLPVVHPRMATPWTDARETPILEQPGFLLSNYGRSTMLLTGLLHLAYGALVGVFAGLA